MLLWQCIYCVGMIICVSTEVILNVRPIPQGKIVGGKPASMKNFPHACVVVNYGSICGGVIVNTWTILSAAHCFDKNQDVDAITMEMGSRWLYDVHASRYAARKLVLHENYNRTNQFSCDISLIFVEKPIQFGPLIQKGILVDHNRWMRETETKFTVIGWGLTKYKGKMSDEGLLMTVMRYVSMKQCSEMHVNQTFSDDMFCLYGYGSKDSCQGDSGGGVVWNGMIVGIVSHGDGCARRNKPSVYANVYYFRPWIHQQIMEYMDWHCDNELDET